MGWPDLRWGLSGKVQIEFFKDHHGRAVRLAARAHSEVNARWVRYAAATVNLAYPVFLGFLALAS